MADEEEPDVVNPEQEPDDIELDNAEPNAAEEIVREVKNEFRKVENFVLDREYCSSRSVVRTLNANFQNDLFCQKDIREHTGCINAAKFSHKEKLLATGGDDGHSRIWMVDELMLRKEPKPISICERPHQSNIFSLEFDLEDRFIYSGDRFGTIFKHDISTNRHVFTSRSHTPQGDAYNLDHHPFNNHQVVVTHCQQISILDDRDYMNPIRIRDSTEDGGGDFYSAEFHPVSPVLLLINSEIEGPIVFDRRYPETALYTSDRFQGFIPNRRLTTGYMGAQWSPSGNQYMVIRKRMCPLYFDIISQRCFQLRTAEGPLQYRNAKTVKSTTFIDDHTVCTGSDNWGIHFWKTPKANDNGGFVEFDRDDGLKELIIEKEMRVLHGHRSIPNQVRYSNHNKLLVSSGVENSFKLWSHCRLPWSYDVPFKRRKRDEYDDPEVEYEREKTERQKLEEEWDEQDLMEGRATWEDVFGGNEYTSEDRETLEMFDTLPEDVEPATSEEEEEEASDEGDIIFPDTDDDDDPWVDIRNRQNGQFEFLIRQGEEVLVRQLGEGDRRLIAEMNQELREQREIRRIARQAWLPHRDWFENDSSDEDEPNQNPALRRWNRMFVEREVSSDEEEGDDEEREGVEEVSDEESEKEEEESDEQTEEDESGSDSDEENVLDVELPFNGDDEDEDEMHDENIPEN